MSKQPSQQDPFEFDDPDQTSVGTKARKLRSETRRTVDQLETGIRELAIRFPHLYRLTDGLDIGKETRQLMRCTICDCNYEARRKIEHISRKHKKGPKQTSADEFASSYYLSIVQSNRLLSYTFDCELLPPTPEIEQANRNVVADLKKAGIRIINEQRLTVISVPSLKRKRICAPGEPDEHIRHEEGSTMPLNTQKRPISGRSEKMKRVHETHRQEESTLKIERTKKATQGMNKETPTSAGIRSVSESDGENEGFVLNPPRPSFMEQHLREELMKNEDISIRNCMDTDDDTLGLVDESTFMAMDEPQCEFTSTMTETHSLEGDVASGESMTTEAVRGAPREIQMTHRIGKQERPNTPSVDFHASESDPYREKTIVESMQEEHSPLLTKIETVNSDNSHPLRNEVTEQLDPSARVSSAESAEPILLSQIRIPKAEPMTSFEELRSSSSPCFNHSPAGLASRESHLEALSPASTSVSEQINGYPDELVDAWTSSVQLIKADTKVPMIYSLWFREMVEINRDLRASLGVHQSYQIPSSPSSSSDEIDDEYSSSLVSMNGDNKLAFMYKISFRQLVNEIRQLRKMERAAN